MPVAALPFAPLTPGLPQIRHRRSRLSQGSPQLMPCSGFYVVAHEIGHAMFDLLDAPVFGRAEDAADAFAVYMMLQLGKRDAERLILGAAYSYKDYMKKLSVCVPLTAFADPHGTPNGAFLQFVVHSLWGRSTIIRRLARQRIPSKKSV